MSNVSKVSVFYYGDEVFTCIVKKLIMGLGITVHGTAVMSAPDVCGSKGRSVCVGVCMCMCVHVCM